MVSRRGFFGRVIGGVAAAAVAKVPSVAAADLPIMGISPIESLRRGLLTANEARELVTTATDGLGGQFSYRCTFVADTGGFTAGMQRALSTLQR